ncbi:MAG TPA: hypothetical protein VLN57_21075 [Xanthobacteraceae bacterium]|nr:hypothetical protein [Xanthobacteraceae bacterium]
MTKDIKETARARYNRLGMQALQAVRRGGPMASSKLASMLGISESVLHRVTGSDTGRGMLYKDGVWIAPHHGGGGGL